MPRAGLLSGMFVTWGTALAAAVVGVAVPALHGAFAATPSRRLVDLLLVSVAAMGVHKLESYLGREYDHCPVYLELGERWGGAARRAGFVSFVGTFLGMMVIVAAVVRGAPWPMLLLAVWCAQGAHELHHLAKTVARRRYYPGTVSGVVFVAFMDVVFAPAYARELVGVDARALLAGYVALQAALFGAFVLEDRLWLRRGGAATVRRAAA